MLRPTSVLTVGGVALALAAGGCGGSSHHASTTAAPSSSTSSTSSAASGSSSPAQFSAQARQVCASVAPRVKATSAAVNGVEKGAGSSISKLPKLAQLLGQLSQELGTLHSGLSRLSAPASQQAPFSSFLTNLAGLQQVTATGAADLGNGTIAGLQAFQQLTPQFNARSRAVSASAKQVPGLASCKRLG